MSDYDPEDWGTVDKGCWGRWCARLNRENQQLRDRLEELEARLSTAYKIKAECNDLANDERQRRMAIQKLLDARDAFIVNEGKWPKFLRGLE
jgi:hypothetical protein